MDRPLLARVVSGYHRLTELNSNAYLLPVLEAARLRSSASMDSFSGQLSQIAGPIICVLT